MVYACEWYPTLCICCRGFAPKVTYLEISGLWNVMRKPALVAYAMAVHHKGGFDAHFVEPVNDRYTCPICHLAAREPMLTKYGHLFCQECLRPLIRGRTVTCPVCREKLKKSQMFLSNMTKHEILSLKIFCDKCEKGCSWQGELRQRDNTTRDVAM